MTVLSRCHFCKRALISYRSNVSNSIVYRQTPKLKGRFYSRDSTRKNFVTTPIFYVNAAPHIGHLYTAVLADAHARWNRLKGSDVFLSTGTDEHGLKIQRAAERNKMSPPSYCDNVSSQFKELFDISSIQYDDYIRTTEERHEKAVEYFWKHLERGGHIYRGSYEGWYSVSDEAFLTSGEITDSITPEGRSVKVSVESGQPVSWMKEENYMFRLSSFSEQIHRWLDGGAVKPSNFEPLVRQYLQELPDLSVSRQRDKLTWGVPVPGDESQTIYVWLDALINYLTVAGYPDNVTRWPPSAQIIGKDILKFHAVYWPAFLMAAGLEPPSRVLCHSHWLVDDRKMSKSIGNVVDPVEAMKTLSVDGLRYFLLKTGTPHSDGNYIEGKVTDCINSGLVNTLGNLIQRCTSAAVNPRQEFPPLDQTSFHRLFSDQEKDTFKSLRNLPDQVDTHFQDLTIYKALDHLMSVLHSTNAMVQRHKPWELAKLPDQSEHLQTVLHLAMETLRTCGILLQPVIPNMADKLLTKLGVDTKSRTVDHVCRDFVTDCSVKLGDDRSVLLNRLKPNS